MAKRIGKYKVSKREAALSAVDGATIEGSLDGITNLTATGTSALAVTTVSSTLAVSGTSFARGYTATTPSLIQKWPAHTDSTAGNATITIAQLLTGILEADPAADITYTLPTAALAVDGVVGCAIGDCIDFSVINTGTATADEIITVAMGTQGTAVGSMGVKCAGVAVGDSEGSGLFRLRFTSVTGTDSYVVYRLA